MNKDFVVLKFMEIISKHRGRENVMPRDKILAHLRPFVPNLDDRTFREIYTRQPICVCEEGLFAPNLNRPLEAKEYFEYLLKRIPRDQAVMRLKILLFYYPCLSWKEENQMELFNNE